MEILKDFNSIGKFSLKPFKIKGLNHIQFFEIPME